MARRRKCGLPLLVGRVRVADGWPLVLEIDVWCPYCKKAHVHGWSPERRRAGHAEHRVAHCRDGSPFLVGGYMIGLDKAARAENAKAFAAHDKLAAAGAKGWAEVLRGGAALGTSAAATLGHPSPSAADACGGM